MTERSSTETTTLDGFRRVGFFADLDEAELLAVASRCERRDFDAGETIIEEGVEGAGLWILVNGAAEVLKGRGQRAMVIAKLRKGEPFGEMSLLTESPTSASIRATGRVRCQFIPRAAFHGLLDDHPTIARKVLWKFGQTISKRLVQVERHFAQTLRRKSRTATIRHLGALWWLATRMMWSYTRVWFRRLIRLPHKPDKLSRIHRVNARRFKKTAFKLKGANVKLGQLASLQVHLLPPEYIEEFRDMRDQVSPTEYPLIVGTIQTEFGLSPLEVFEEFDRVPLAAASMGQVHVARLPSGEKVAVKMLHPGLERAVDVDLWVMRRLLGVMSLFSGKLDLRELYRQSEEPLRKELDLMHEARATQEIGRELVKLGVKVPEIHTRYTTQRVLVSEFIDGCAIDDLEQIDAWGVSRNTLMQDYLKAFFHQAFEGGFFHCDPHPGNAFCMRDGTLVMIDFGMVKRLPPLIREGLLKEALGGFFSNARLYAEGVVMRGIIGESEREKLETIAAELFADPEIRQALFDHDTKKDGDMKRLFGKLGETLDKFDTFRMPKDELMFLRALGIVITTVREVCPETPLQQLAMPVLMPIMMRFMAANPEFSNMSVGGPPR